MAQVLSPQTTESQTAAMGARSSATTTAAPNNPNFSSLPPLMTSPPLRSQQGVQRAPSHQYKHRLSTFSIRSNNSNSNMFPAAGSRPQSVAFPQFHSSLPYTLVRDFAYAPYHLLHYGPPPERESGISTPASEAQHRRLSDPIPTWSGQKLQRESAQQQPWSSTGDYLPNTSFGDHDGPPYSEDEDLASPVVTSSRHRKNRSNPPSLTYHGLNGDGAQTYYMDNASDGANGPGGEFITFPNASAQQPHSATSNTSATSSEGLAVPSSTHQRRRDSHFAQMLPNRSYEEAAAAAAVQQAAAANYDFASSPESPSDASSDFIEADPNRYSRDYQFTIASPDEEMHGRAVALFDFAQENENELPLVEGQVVLISYRHGQGWLVAQDPKTGDTGLVPEEYVRLLRDIEGGLHGLMMNGGVQGVPGAGDDDTPTDSSAEAKTPTQVEHHPQHAHAHNQGPHALVVEQGKKEEYYAPVVSTFSTSREDLEPWPHHLLGSQVTTPTLPKESYAASPTRRGSGSGSHSRSRSPVKREREAKGREREDS